ncbi:restriction endonuclease subunit S [Mycoplasma mycoides subsp. capri]|uniref:restriction endonuclease subunit S n=1 Tax=Mycoplasma mycoides TaxID=2102 RepID=UPI00223FC03D|nr:restriction endonuclease subunit S [Mycoplasma mycoides]UZK64206.1 restriction endonuclease subunit S [Mycoplasma mycoides subsp. capri]
MKQNELFPKIRFKEFTNAWEQEKLGNLGVFKSSSVDKIIRNNEQFINLINYMDVYNKLIITSKNINKLMRVTASKKQINECSILKNDVLFTPSSETADDIAHSKVIEETLKNTLFSYHLIRYRPNQNIFYSLFPDYLFDTNHFKKQASLLAKGVQRFVLGKPEFESLNVIFPNINEQTKITKTFRYIDSLITLHQRKLILLKNTKNRLLEKMFCDEKSEFPSIRFKEFTNAWEQWKIGNMFEIGRGYVIPKKDIKDRKSGQYIYPIYSSQTLNNGLLGYYKKYLKSNAITWTTDGANAGTISYRKDRFYATNVCGILSTKVFAPNIYLALALSKIAYKHVTKVGNPKLMNNIMSNIDILISSNLPEQNKISFLFSNLDSLITLHQRKLELLKNIKNTLLEKMFV